MTPLPVTVIAGYLGAGKTTLINRLLAEDHGLSLMIIVNDFGAINIDASLLRSAEEDTIALTNGCICCTMGDDLHRALDVAIDRQPRPDHLIIEASGIADPAVIANAAIAEPALSYGGIVTLVDGANLGTQLRDAEIAEQVAHQISAGDLILVTKTDHAPEVLTGLSARKPQLLSSEPLAPLLLDIVPLPKGRATAKHPAYTAWQVQSDLPISRAELGAKLKDRPKGIYRLKGRILTDDGGYEIHVVGGYVSARRASVARTELVALGPKSQVSIAEIEAWWGDTAS